MKKHASRITINFGDENSSSHRVNAPSARGVSLSVSLSVYLSVRLSDKSRMHQERAERLMLDACLLASSSSSLSLSSSSSLSKDHPAQPIKNGTDIFCWVIPGVQLSFAKQGFFQKSSSKEAGFCLLASKTDLDRRQRKKRSRNL